MSTLPDENLDAFVDNWGALRNRIIVFLGAGASIGARNRAGHRLPNAYDLRNELWKKFKWDGSGRDFDPAELRLMTLEHAAAIIEAKIGRTILREYLHDTFCCEKPLWQHIALPNLKPVSLFTTNYDELIEIGYKSSLDMLDVICNDRSPVPGRTALYKPHGSLSHANQSVGHGGLVITQFDYLEIIADYRAMLQNAMTSFSSTCVLVIGYSFGDMDIGSELYSIRKRSDGIPWYAVFPRGDRQVRHMYSRRFGIEQINRTFEEFLLELDERVNFIPDRFKHKNKNALISEGLIQ